MGTETIFFFLNKFGGESKRKIDFKVNLEANLILKQLFPSNPQKYFAHEQEKSEVLCISC